jgi:hypothetical protein
MNSCNRPWPDYWFTEVMTVNQQHLPQGVRLDVVNPNQTTEYIQITNSSSTPLYIIAKPYLQVNHQFEPMPIAYPPHTGPLHKVVANQVFTWKSVEDVKQQGRHWQWEKESRSPTDTILLSIVLESLTVSGGTVVNLAPRNQSGDNRPANPPLPPDQQIQIPLVYGSQPISIPVTISYDLNTAYDPHSLHKSNNACKNILSQSTLVGGVKIHNTIIFVLVVLIAGLWWFFLFKKNVDNR